MNVVNENQMYRFQILMEMYRQSQSDIDYIMDIQQLAMQIGISNKNFQSAYKYLYMHDFIQMHAQGNFNGNGGMYQANITHKGVKAVEDVFRDINRATEFFPPYREMMM